ncbi:hypothetical protein CW731_14185 [Polaribacter sp. ALD11]|nr:hypothetical protein CW731_14185 [Polaribacter sp. ALD11]
MNEQILFGLLLFLLLTFTAQTNCYESDCMATNFKPTQHTTEIDNQIQVKDNTSLVFFNSIMLFRITNLS